MEKMEETINEIIQMKYSRFWKICKKMKKVTGVILLSLFCLFQLSAKQIFVAPWGDDNNPGTLKYPLKSINLALKSLEPGDTCFLRGGTYRETALLNKSGTADKPIFIYNYPGEIPVLKGTDVVNGEWQLHKNKIYKTKLESGLNIKQVFINENPMIMARWPNTTFKERWNTKKWRETGPNSSYGEIIDSEFKTMDVNLKGAIITLNTHPNWNKWTSEITDHTNGSERIRYNTSLQWKTLGDEGKGGYYLSGALGLLDSSEEWYYDNDTGWLYIYFPEDYKPNNSIVEVKTRNYGFYADRCNYVRLKGIYFWGCTFNFRECNFNIVDECHILFPNNTHILSELNMNSRPTVCTQMIGHHNVFKNSSLAHSPTFGIRMLGSFNVVENNIIHDVNWVGSLVYANIWMGSLEDNYSWEGTLKYKGLLKETIEQATKKDIENVKWGGKLGSTVKVHDPDKVKPAGQCTVRYNTLYNSGNIVLGFFEQPNYEISHNFVFGGGQFVEDVSMIYTTLPQITGSTIHHNWVFTDKKICIRADDQSRGVKIHHNVMWGASHAQLIVKGDSNKVFNNTALGNSPWGLNIQTKPEPYKPHYRKLWPLLDKQNSNTVIANNLANKITYFKNKPFNENDSRLINNITSVNPETFLDDPANLNFQPEVGSLLIDSGEIVVTSNYKGGAPDIGAYERSDKYWIPGCRNYIKIIDIKIDSATKIIEVKTVLALPPLVETIAKVKINHNFIKEASRDYLIFNRNNWNRPKTIYLKFYDNLLQFNSWQKGFKFTNKTNFSWLKNNQRLFFDFEINFSEIKLKQLLRKEYSKAIDDFEK